MVVLRYIFLIPLALLACTQLSAQRTVSSDFSKFPSVVTYGVDYLIKGVDTAGVDILCKIDMEKYLSYRKKNERVEVKDTVTGVIIILFSEKELQIIREPYYKLSPVVGRKNE